MSTEAVSRPAPIKAYEQLRLVREISRTSGQALLSLSDRLADELCQAVDVTFLCRDSAILHRYGPMSAWSGRGLWLRWLQPTRAITSPIPARPSTVISGKRSLT
jgi:hypothetical protein